jgi:hypothetical protein
MDLSVIIVNYNTKKLTKQTIESCIRTIKDLDYEIWVVDNASTDGSQTYFQELFKEPFIHFIYNNDNLGFSKANNQAIERSTGEYVLLLNSDTIAHTDAINSCINYIRNHSDIGALGCKLILKNGALDHTCKRGFPTPEASLYYFLKFHKLFPNNQKYGAYSLSYVPDDAINEVDAIVGAFMLLPRKVIEQVGLLDEDFFMFGEDLDWCYRIKDLGYKILYYPEAIVTHLKGQSSKKKRTKIIYEFHRAMYLFYKKHYKEKYPIYVTALVYMGIGLRFMLSLFVNLFKK